MEFKETVRILSKNLGVFPRWRTERYSKERKKEFQWIIEPKNRFGFGLRGNGNIVIQDKNGRNTYTHNTFFLKPRLTKEQKDEILEACSDYLIYVKLKKGTLCASEITKCKNAEIRRLILEEFGYEKFVEFMKGVTIHTDGDSKLIKINWHKDEETMKFVRVKDSSTSRYYLLRVPPETKTCKQGIAWTFDMKENQYNPLKET